MNSSVLDDVTPSDRSVLVTPTKLIKSSGYVAGKMNFELEYNYKLPAWIEPECFLNHLQ